MSLAARAMLDLLRQWQSLSRDKRDEMQGYVVIAAEKHLFTDDDAPSIFLAWSDISMCAAPIPSPFALRGLA